MEITPTATTVNVIKKKLPSIKNMFEKQQQKMNNLESTSSSTSPPELMVIETELLVEAKDTDKDKEQTMKPLLEFKSKKASKSIALIPID
jgi:hypothetical protein